MVAAGAFEEALWTGANVFPESAQTHERGASASADVVAWDHIDDTYTHLRCIVNDCLGRELIVQPPYLSPPTLQHKPERHLSFEALVTYRLPVPLVTFDTRPS